MLVTTCRHQGGYGGGPYGGYGGGRGGRGGNEPMDWNAELAKQEEAQRVARAEVTRLRVRMRMFLELHLLLSRGRQSIVRCNSPWPSTPHQTHTHIHICTHTQ